MARLEWDGEAEDRRAAASAAQRHAGLLAHAVGEPITIGNEFAEVRVVRVETRNGSRLLIESPKSGQWITLDPLELESLTWQNDATLSALVGHPYEPLIADAVEDAPGGQRGDGRTGDGQANADRTGDGRTGDGQAGEGQGGDDPAGGRAAGS